MDNIQIMVNFIEDLNKDNSSNYKLEVLKKYKEYEIIRNLLYYTYNPRYQYFVKKLPEQGHPHRLTSYDIAMFALLDILRLRHISGNEALKYIKSFLSNCDERLINIFTLIIGRDLKCGINVKSINKAIPNLIPTTPYMRCSPLNDKTVKKFEDYHGELIVQKKSDGIFSYIIIEDGKVSLLTRNGSPWQSPKLQAELGDIKENLVLIGEGLIYGSDGKELDRKTGNGMINSLIKAEATTQTLLDKIENASTRKQIEKFENQLLLKNKDLQEIDNKLHFECWDIITLEEFEAGYSSGSYETRLNHLHNVLQNRTRVSLSRTDLVDSVEEAQKIGQDYIDNGYEGAILKLPTMIFENKTSKDQLKIKQVLDCDLRCVGFEEGTGKYEGKIGALFLESSCSQLRVKVGTGFTDEDREKPFSYYENQVIEVKYNEKISSKGKDTYSLFLPVFVEVRFDKDRVDRLEEIV